MTIKNDDYPRVSITEATAQEGKVLGFKLTLDQSVSTPITVGITTQDREASEGFDYQSPPETVTFSPGKQTAYLQIETLADKKSEGDETFRVVLNANSNVEFEGDGYATGTIQEAAASGGKVNAPPVASNDILTFPYSPSGVYKVSAAQLLANDTDSDKDKLGVIDAEGADLNGTNLTLNSEATKGATEIFTYTVSDGKGGSAVGNAQVNIKRYHREWHNEQRHKHFDACDHDQWRRGIHE
jgi:hypothetical protein